MLLVADTLNEIRKSSKKLVGFYGSPPRDMLLKTALQHNAKLVDLDVYYGAEPLNIVPKAFCHIIRNCVDNALALKEQLVCVTAATGKEKCDAGRFAARLIREHIGHLGIEVIFTEREDAPPSALPLLCEAKGSLKKRTIRIMRGIVEPLTEAEKQEATALACKPTHGFWGTPPHPIEVLDLFPDTTHIFGWTRCVEQETPANLELENYVVQGLPTVFFSQGFCHKAALAKYLADKHGGIHVDVHDTLNAAVVAKIEAFIRLSVPTGSKLS